MKKRKNIITIAIDSPAAAGAGTVAKSLLTMIKQPSNSSSWSAQGCLITKKRVYVNILMETIGRRLIFSKPWCIQRGEGLQGIVSATKGRSNGLKTIAAKEKKDSKNIFDDMHNQLQVLWIFYLSSNAMVEAGKTRTDTSVRRFNHRKIATK